MLYLSLRPSSMRFEPAAPLMRPMFFTQAIGDRIDGVALYTQASVDNDTFDGSSVRVHWIYYNLELKSGQWELE